MASYKKVDQQSLVNDNDTEYDEGTDTQTADPLPEKRQGIKAELRGFKLIVIGCVVFAAGITIALVIDIIIKDPITGHGAVSSDVDDCSVIGAKLMKTGANGIDAAVATAFCVSVYNLGSTGIGSGGYMLIHGPNGLDKAIDFQFMASANATKDMFAKDAEAAKRGGLSVAIPGFVHGMKAAHDKFGKISWSKLLDPSIQLANDGFGLQSYTANMIRDNFNSLSQELKDVVAPNGKIPMAGTTIKYPKLAQALKEIALHGTAAVYAPTGMIAKEIISTVTSKGGILTAADLASYDPITKNVIGAEYNGYRVLTSSAPSSGIVVLSALKAIDRFHLTESDDVNSFQVIIEALKFAFAGRSHLGDPEFRPEMDNVTKYLLSAKLSENIESNITLNATHDAAYYDKVFAPLKTPGTSQISVMGPNEELVSITTTLGLPFGSGLATQSGIVLNDGMISFSSSVASATAAANKANLIEPLKRPLSAAAPLIVFHKDNPCQDMMVLGAAGGEKLISALVQVLVDVLSYGMPLNHAIEDRPRIHHQLYPNKVLAEGKRFQSIPKLSNILSSLKKIGHEVDDTHSYLGTVNGVALKDDKIIAHSDSRINGKAAKF